MSCRKRFDVPDASSEFDQVQRRPTGSDAAMSFKRLVEGGMTVEKAAAVSGVLAGD